jgi:uncharacterized protein (DUF952 family)
MYIYHISRERPDSHASDVTAPSLADEGFIHCSRKEQLEAVLGRYFRTGERVFILTIDPARLTPEMIEEPSTGGEFYPHVYGPINRTAIVGVEERTV